MTAANTRKKSLKEELIQECRYHISFYVDYLWNFCKIHDQCYNVPKYIESEIKPEKYKVSARILKCLATQACGIVKSRVKKLSKIQFIIKKLQRSGKNSSKLQSRYDKLLNKLKKPSTKNALPELNSICCEWIDKVTTHFDGLIVLSSIGNYYGKIAIPVKRTSHFNELATLGKRKNSFLLGNTSIGVRFEIKVEQKEEGETEGADQGMRTCVTLSDGQTTSKDIHGHDLESICKKVSKKKKGSKAFQRAQAHRTNYINHAIKNLNFTGLKQINLEKLRHMGRGQRKSRYLQSFVYKEIRIAMENACQLNGVRLVEQSNAYRSQRCSHCGFVHKSSRRGELFKCKNCNFTCNADLNAAMNHKACLCDLPSRFQHLPNRTTGFFWNSSGLMDVNGAAITVPLA